jgi:hypothetical protein
MWLFCQEGGLLATLGCHCWVGEDGGTRWLDRDVNFLYHSQLKRKWDDDEARRAARFRHDAHRAKRAAKPKADTTDRDTGMEQHGGKRVAIDGRRASVVTKSLGTWRYRRQHHQHQLTLSLCARNEFATRIAPAAARRRPSRRRGLGQAAQAMHHRVARDRALL